MIMEDSDEGRRTLTEGFEKVVENIDGSTVDQDALLIDLAVAFSTTCSVDDTRSFIEDLLTERERTIIARRLRIAVLLQAGFTYEAIRNQMGASPDTVTRVAKWLANFGQGYRCVIERLAEVGRLEESVGGGRQNARLLELGQRDARRYAPYGDAFWPTEIVDAVCAGMKRAKEKNGPNL
jgi:TrpR-related protein YerC/YecD